MPSPLHTLTTQEAASLTGEGLMPELEALLRECRGSLQAKYLINDSQQTHFKTHKLRHTHTHTEICALNCHSPLVHNQTELNVPFSNSSDRAQSSKLKSIMHIETHEHTEACTLTHICREKDTCSETAATETETGYSTHPCGAQPFPPCIFYILQMSGSPLHKLQLAKHSQNQGAV